MEKMLVRYRKVQWGVQGVHVWSFKGDLTSKNASREQVCNCNCEANKKDDLHFMGWTHMGMRKASPVRMFQSPPKIKEAVRSTWPVKDRDSMMGSRVPRSPREPLSSPRRKPERKEWRRSLASALSFSVKPVGSCCRVGRTFDIWLQVGSGWREGMYDVTGGAKIDTGSGR